MDIKKCAVCKKELSLDHFAIKKDGSYNVKCFECSLRDKKWLRNQRKALNKIKDTK